MTAEPYLQRLTGRLIDGLERVPPATRELHGHWLKARQNPDGGFSGREGGSDLYYTGFALRGLAVLQQLDEPIAARAGEFLKGQLDRQASIVDLFSLLVGTFLVQLAGGPNVLAEAPPDWPDRVAATLEAHRHADGGYSKTPEGVTGSTYTTFLVALALELLGKPMPRPEETIRFLQARARNGGFVEIPQMKRAGTNPTAAGIGILQVLNALDDATRQGVTEFLLPMWSPQEGAFRANDRIPAGDLLSSFTASWTLADVGSLDRINRPALQNYVAMVQDSDGGFRGGTWDNGVDVEYTFYGLGLLALLAEGE
jgi:geranylgeranyl transferase type-2 subunit beta